MTVCIFVGAWLLLIAVLIYWERTAPLGHEDEKGFHYSDE